jgi:hypothetical protein
MRREVSRPIQKETPEISDLERQATKEQMDPEDPTSAAGKQTILTPSPVGFGNSGTVWLGESLTLSILEFHSDAAASSLSDILETGDLPLRYYLSAKACQGILRRAETRGKELPHSLASALMSVALTQETPLTGETSNTPID